MTKHKGFQFSSSIIVKYQLTHDKFVSCDGVREIIHVKADTPKDKMLFLRAIYRLPDFDSYSYDGDMVSIPDVIKIYTPFHEFNDEYTPFDDFNITLKINIIGLNRHSEPVFILSSTSQ